MKAVIISYIYKSSIMQIEVKYSLFNRYLMLAGRFGLVGITTEIFNIEEIAEKAEYLHYCESQFEYVKAAIDKIAIGQKIVFKRNTKLYDLSNIVLAENWKCAKSLNWTLCEELELIQSKQVQSAQLKHNGDALTFAACKIIKYILDKYTEIKSTIVD